MQADEAQKLAHETAEAAGITSPATTAVTDLLALPNRQLPTDAAGHPKPTAQSTFTDPDSYIFKGANGWIQG
jgi:hypothetical protein